jgi:glycosyltransferase involved in cell wall biosynthesis
VDWWFAYTQRSAQIVARSGFSVERITTVQNAIDTTSLIETRGRLILENLDALRRDLFGDPVEAPTGVFCGRLTALKWIPFLLEVLTIIKKEIPDFRMVIVGDGPEKPHVAAFCKRNPWCVWVGAQHGDARVPYLALGDLWLNPGMTGLSVLDSFALGLPFLTTENGIHSPEIDYLEAGVNGDLSAPTVAAFAGMVAQILQDKARLQKMKVAARSCGENYTIENMTARFAAGLAACVQTIR